MMRIIAGIAIFSMLALPCLAQRESLLIGPGDLVYVEVFDTPGLAQEVRVTDAGTVPLEFIGDVKLAGETPAAAAKIVARALVDKKIMREPQVTVRVAEDATRDVSVLCQVPNPGAYPITTAQPVLKVLTLAGGLTGMADRNITIERHHDSSQRIQYYFANNAQQAMSDDVMVNPGDIVVVPRAPIIYVLGDVARPGAYPINTNDSPLT